ncbi:MAG: methionyl-tRNA formyltransferase [Candidatus Omnitrophica bacterium]|nr:methionyl-tRNA formyltransferase [Candidatus Omnitrophota bacterium]
MKPAVRVVYVGAERVGLACLEKLVELQREVVGVFTAHPDLRPQIADYTSFDSLVEPLGVPYFRIRSSDDPEFVRQVQALRPDLVLVISWSQRIPKEVISFPRLGCVGLHYSLLPSRRGGAPLFWALRDGLRESGITFFHLDERIDAGDIIARQRFEISRQDTCKTLLDKIVLQAPVLMAAVLSSIENGTAPRTPQDERLASVTPKRGPEESLLPEGLSLEEIYNFIRALAPPYPSAYALVGGHKLVMPSARFEGKRLWIEGYLE